MHRIRERYRLHTVNTGYQKCLCVQVACRFTVIYIFRAYDKENKNKDDDDDDNKDEDIDEDQEENKYRHNRVPTPLVFGPLKGDTKQPVVALAFPRCKNVFIVNLIRFHQTDTENNIQYQPNKRPGHIYRIQFPTAFRNCT